MINYKKIAEKFIEDNELNYGNAEVVGFRNGDFYIDVTVEAPNNWTNTISICVISLPNKQDFQEELKKEFRDMALDINVDSYFNDLWSSSFAKHNNFTASEFLKMLVQDKEFYKNIANSYTLGYDSTKGR